MSFLIFSIFFSSIISPQLNPIRKNKVVAASLASWGVWAVSGGEGGGRGQLEAQSCPWYYDKPQGSMRRAWRRIWACVCCSLTAFKEGKIPRQCLKEGNCKALKYSFFECKRSMLDGQIKIQGKKRILILLCWNQDEKQQCKDSGH